MTRVKRGIGLVLSAICSLTACHTSGSHSSDVLDVPVQPAQQRLAIDAVDKLRADWNSGACQFIYDRAAPSFRSQSAEDWVIQCEKLREDLGSWRAFNTSSTERCAAPAQVVCVNGSAVFEHDVKALEVAWLLQNQQVQLSWIGVQQDRDHWMHLPSLETHPLLDPPKRPRRNDRVG